MPRLVGGGAERVMLVLAGHFAAHGWQVDVVVDAPAGATPDTPGQGHRTVTLDATSSLRSVLPLARYLADRRPDILVSGLGHTNVAALLSRRLAPVRTAVVVCQHNALSAECAKGRPLRYRMLPACYRLMLPLADAIVAVSDGVARDMERVCRLSSGRVRTIHNPAWSPAQETEALTPLADPWFAAGAPPVVLGVGRLSPQKDFATLIGAFARARAHGTVARLMILGDGPERARLESLVQASGHADAICFAGFQAAPLGYVSRAALVVLSSRYEGFGNVLVEALGCGTPVVSSDCPYGPAEILAGGRYGRLVAVGDVDAMAGAIRASLAAPCDRAALRARAAAFDLATSAAGYARVFDSVLGRRAGPTHTEIAARV